MSYNRSEAVDYAHKWAYGRNPQYLNFDNLGGDCTNFISQCLYSGCKTMNYTPTFGWYYKDGNHKAPAWTGVQQLHKFLLANKGPGPFAVETSPDKLEKGDIIQLSFDGNTYAHSTIVVELKKDVQSLGDVLIACHTYDSDYRPVSTYNYQKIRFLHIEGAN